MCGNQDVCGNCAVKLPGGNLCGNCAGHRPLPLFRQGGGAVRSGSGFLGQPGGRAARTMSRQRTPCQDAPGALWRHATGQGGASWRHARRLAAAGRAVRAKFILPGGGLPKQSCCAVTQKQKRRNLPQDDLPHVRLAPASPERPKGRTAEQAGRSARLGATNAAPILYWVSPYMFSRRQLPLYSMTPRPGTLNLI